MITKSFYNINVSPFLPLQPVCLTKHYTLHTKHYTIHSKHYTLYIIHYILIYFTHYTLHFTFYNSHFTLYTIHYTLPTIHNTLCTIQYIHYTKSIFTRPGVAGAVLQTPLSFINSFSQSVSLFLQIFNRPSLPSRLS